MSNKIKSPTQSSNRFLIILIAVLVIVAVVIGYIVVSGKQRQKDAFNASLDNVTMEIDTTGDYIQLKGVDPAPDVKTVDLFEDYSCPHCGELAEATDGDMKTQIEAGKLIVNIHTLAFLDGSVGHSSRAGSAAYEVARQGDAQLYWNYRKTLFEKRADIFSSWQNEQFAELAKQLGADSSTVKAIADSSEAEAFAALVENNTKKLTDAQGRVSSPVVLYEGKAISYANEAGTDFANWPLEVVDGNVRYLDNK